MCRQNSGKRLLPSNINYQFINIKKDKRFWRGLADTTTFYI